MSRWMTGIAAVALMGALAVAAQAKELKTAVVAGGCFWCVESDFDKVPGVVKTVSGYTGGTLANPTYEQVGHGGTGHREAVEVTYDPAVISYADLLTVFWHSVDPTDAGGQFCDRGPQYATAVFVADADERRQAEESKEAAQTDLGKPVVTPIEDLGPFYPAEGYHQDYHNKSSLKYQYYRWACGRNERIEEVWGPRAFMGIPKDE